MARDRRAALRRSRRPHRPARARSPTAAQASTSRALLAPPSGPRTRSPLRAACQATAPAAPLDRELLALAGDALARGEQITVERAVHNTDRAIGALLSGEIVRRLGPDALADGALTLRLPAPPGRASAPGACAALVLDLEGQANDYVGKGLSGGAHRRAAARRRRLRADGQHRRRQHDAVRRDLGRAVRARARGRALRGAQLGRDRRRRGRRATTAAST